MACDLVICIAHDPHEQLLRRFPPRTNAKIQATVGTLRVCRKILNSLRFLLRSVFTCASENKKLGAVSAPRGWDTRSLLDVRSLSGEGFSSKGSHMTTKRAPHFLPGESHSGSQ